MTDTFHLRPGPMSPQDPLRHSKDVGLHLRRRRTEVGLTRRAVAEAAAPYIDGDWELARIEGGDAAVTVDQLMVLSILIGTTPAHLLMPFTAPGAESNPRAPVCLPGGDWDNPDDRRWAGAVWCWLGGTASLRPLPSQSVEAFPPPAIREQLGDYGMAYDIEPPFAWLSEEYADMHDACWFNETGGLD